MWYGYALEAIYIVLGTVLIASPRLTDLSLMSARGEQVCGKRHEADVRAGPARVLDNSPSNFKAMCPACVMDGTNERCSE